MKQKLEFAYSPITMGLLYAWSRKHDITFAIGSESPIRIHFGREQDLTMFILTWSHDRIEYTVL